LDRCENPLRLSQVAPFDTAYFQNRQLLRDKREDPIGKIRLSLERIELFYPPGFFIGAKKTAYGGERAVRRWYSARDNIDERSRRRDHEETVP
jgi:hypothetical protein